MDLTVPVTLIVKAPNQQIEDQTVKCELSWTILKLKGHLSEVYPSKPARDEQKLIYSGQLLSDSVVLKDVLRNYDEQNTHTVHLVCTTPRSFKFDSPTVKPQPKPQMEATTTSAAETAPSGTAASTSTSGLRHRNIANSTQETMTDFQSIWSSLSQPQTHIVDPTQYAVQMSLFQQAYVQYINQYMQMVTNQLPPRDINADHPEPPAVPEQNGPDAPVDNLEEGEIPADRDWLDWFYIFSRVLVLFCIVYFYSSPLRFAFVLLFGIGLYLYQMGFFRVQVVNNNELRRPENNNVVVPPVAPDAAPQIIVNNAVAPQGPTMLTIMWTFFTTFFASLLPEVPNAI